MNKTSYQVSDASIKRYWKMWENNRKQDDRKYPMELFDEWSDKENLYVGARYDALRLILPEDFELLRSVMSDYRETKRKLNKIAEAFEIITDLNADNQ